VHLGRSSRYDARVALVKVPRSMLGALAHRPAVENFTEEASGSGGQGTTFIS